MGGQSACLFGCLVAFCVEFGFTPFSDGGVQKLADFQPFKHSLPANSKPVSNTNQPTLIKPKLLNCLQRKILLALNYYYYIAERMDVCAIHSLLFAASSSFCTFFTIPPSSHIVKFNGNTNSLSPFIAEQARMVESDSRIKAYKFVAYSAVTFSVVAVLSVVITLPMVYNYVSHVRRQMQHELNFCKASLINFEKGNEMCEGKAH